MLSESVNRLLPLCDHPVAPCATCQRSYAWSEVGADLRAVPTRYACPRCQGDLTLSLLVHAETCRNFAAAEVA